MDSVADKSTQSNSEELLDKIKDKYPCRQKQVQSLYNYYAEYYDCIPNAVYIYGHHAVGKTSVIREFFELMKTNFVIVNCIEGYSNRLIFEPILNKILSQDSERKCDSFMDFVAYLESAKIKGLFSKGHFVIVFDAVEYLDTGGNSLLSGLIKLQDITAIYNLGVIFISHILPGKFNVDHSLLIPIHFPQYSKDELMTILSLDKPVEHSKQFYSSYLTSALSVFFPITRDLNELRLMISKNFKKYCEPIENGSVRMADLSALWRHIAPHFKSSLLSVFSGTVPSLENSVPQNDREATGSKVILSFDVPFYEKYLLISAYLASHNSSKFDKRLFMKSREKKRKSKVKPKESGLSELLGPRAFHIDRLLAIFYAIVEDKASLTADLMSGISTLCELRLMIKLGDGVLDKPKYKCNAGLSCVDSVAKTVGFDLKRYLLG